MKIAVIVGHPRAGAYCEALGNAYAAGARAAGHDVEVIKLSGLTFDPILREGFGEQELEPDLLAAQQAIGAAGHTVWAWPLWLGYPPALMKGFLEQLLTQGFAIEKLDGPPFYRPLLQGKSARVIVTMQMSSLMFRFVAFDRDPGLQG